MSKNSRTFLREIKPYVELHRDPNTGIAWVANGSTGMGHSAHPNIAASGSVTGMKRQGYWAKDAVTVRSHGFIYNISALIDAEDEYDKIAADNCQCATCQIRHSQAANQPEDPIEVYKQALVNQGLDPEKIEAAFAEAAHLLEVMEDKTTFAQVAKQLGVMEDNV